MKVVSLSNVAREPVAMEGAAGASRQVPISRDHGSPTVSFRVFTIEPGGHTPYHEHPYEHVNYVIAGAGCLVSGDGARHPVREGDFALVLPGEKHQYRNDEGTVPMVMICAVPKAFE